MAKERLRWRIDKVVQRAVVKAWHLLRAATRRVGLQRQDQVRLWCSALWERSAVLSDGTVVCSCRDEAKRIVLGNILEQPFDQIWNGVAYREARARILDGKALDPLCQKCPFLSQDRPSEASLPQSLFSRPGFIWRQASVATWRASRALVLKSWARAPVSR